MIEVKKLSLGYEKTAVLKNINLQLHEHEITTIIGPNGSGKSTLLKALTRCLKPTAGEICYNGASIHAVSTRELAKQFALLPQNPAIPPDYTVYDLVCQGRFPYANWTGRLKKQDHEIVDWALEVTHVAALSQRLFATLSGGEKQRACIAMALAQQPSFLFLDEPTTHLDIAHQFEVLELIHRLNDEMNLSIIMVLHDLNHAINYSDRIVVIHEQGIYADGRANAVIQQTLCEEVFGIAVRLITDPISGTQLVIPVRQKMEKV